MYFVLIILPTVSEAAGQSEFPRWLADNNPVAAAIEPSFLQTMKSKTHPKKTSPVRNEKSVAQVLGDVLRWSRRPSAYVFMASLGVWLPRAEAATLVNLDAASQPLGELSIWPNTGSVAGDFTVPPSGVAPTNTLVDGVKGIAFVGGTGGAGSHYVGPIAPNSVGGAGARTVEAWIFNNSSQDEETVFAWGRRGGDGLNNSFGHGANAAYGGVAMWGAPDIGWGNTDAQVATNRVLNRWTYIVQTFDGTTSRLYVDGRLANSEGAPATLQINTATQDTGLQGIPFRVARQIEDSGAVSDAGAGDIVIGRLRVEDVALSSLAISNQFFLEKGQFNLNDTDTDGMPDWWEERFGLNKNSAADAITDLDTDGLNNLAEYQRGTNPTDTDSDDDGLTDGVEVNRIDPQTAQPAPTNPLAVDSDNDTLSDAVETDTGTFVSASNTGTDPLKGDTDGDVLSDGAEIACGSNPNNPASTCSLARAIDLDATALAGGPLTNWVNTGFVVGNFTVPTNATVPLVTTNDGVKSVALLATGTADNGTHYVGPGSIAAVTGANPRTIEAWVFDTTPQDEEIIFAWGKRAGASADGANYPFGLGEHNTWGAVAAWGTPDIGWNDREVHGRWTHVAATYDGTTTRLYSEGEEVNTEVVAINTVQLDTLGNPLPFRIGRQNNEAGGIDGTGQGQINIAKIRVYTNALDGATLKARFDSEKASFGLVDTDGDGLPDWYEIRWSLNKNDATGANGASGNPDNDGLTNLQEYQLGTGATVADTDGDGVNDGAEVNRTDVQSGLPAATNPLRADTDGDGLRDGVETDTGNYVSAVNTGSDPLTVDTDGDTFSDGLEVGQGSNPVNAAVVPSPNPRLELLSTNLPAGPLTNWVNSGTFSNGMAFVAQAGVGSVQPLQGIPALRLPTNVYYDGPTNPAAANLTGNPVYSIEAWVFNEGPAVGEEIVLAWGRRGNDGINNAFGHGNSGDFGAMGHWGAQDLGWNGVVNMGRWTYIVYTYDAATSIQRAFVDGVQVNQETLGAPLNIAAEGTAGPARFRIGAQNAATGDVSGTGRASGLSIAELRVYSRVLSTNTIASNFATGRIFYGLADNDNDGITDYFERQYPGCLSENNAADANLDCDNDGLTNQQEFLAGTNPTNPDTDGDGIPDGLEVNPTTRPFPTSPIDPDTDRDGLNDNVETGTGIYVGPNDTGTTANFADTDGDGIPDATEVAYRLKDGVTNPNDGGSVPNLLTPVPLVSLDAAGLPIAPLTTWTNLSGLPGWNFLAPTGAVANVELVDGSRGVTLNTTNYYTGHGAPAYMGGNASRSVEAWIFNPTRTGEEAVFAWGRRGGPDGSNSGFAHGTDAGFGALQFWGGGPDVPWGTDVTSISNNVVTARWTHVAYTYDNTTGIRACYKDGVLANSETNGVGVVLNTFTTDNTAFTNALPFRVGAQNEADGTRSGAAAPSLSIAKLRVYDLALTGAQIADRYNAEKAQFPGQPRITAVRVNPGNGFVSFDWVPLPGRTYAVERNTNVGNPASWTTIATGQAGGSYTNDPAGAANSYYRLRVEP